VNQEQSKAAEGKHAVSQEATFSEDLPQACFAYQAKIANRPLNTPIRFDYESFLIGIDNHASRCISNCIDDFQSAIKPTNKQLAGISGSLTIKGTGTVKWIIEDDDGICHSINIPNTLFVPEAPMRLLSPQLWSQTASDTGKDQMEPGVPPTMTPWSYTGTKTNTNALSSLIL
jgi:hypothetical protein